MTATTDPHPWIRVVPPGEADGKLRKLYQRVAGPDGDVDNIMQVHSLRPHSMEGHMALYKNVLHHTGNTIPKWFLEALGVLVSALNRCLYCVDHHATGMTRLIGDEERSKAVREAIESEDRSVFNDAERAALTYAEKLTLTPADMEKSDVRALRDAGWSDGEILEINQVVSYFAYANRTVLGLGVSIDGDILGLSPSGEGWRHE